MASVNVFTAARSQAIEDKAVVSGLIDIYGHLILSTNDGTTIDAGLTKGDQGAAASIGDVVGLSDALNAKLDQSDRDEIEALILPKLNTTTFTGHTQPASTITDFAAAVAAINDARPTAWTNVTAFDTGFSSYSSYTLQVKREGYDVHAHGLLTRSGGFTSGLVIYPNVFTIPEGFRPLDMSQWIRAGSNTASAQGTWLIAPNGQVDVRTNNASSGYMGFFVSWRTD